MTNRKRILVPLSLSGDRDVAFERALALAKAWGSELYLLHAVPAYERFSYRATGRLQRSKELRERAEAARWRQRSVAESVLRRTKRPTLVVGSHDAGDRSTFENVLVAVDLSPASTALIDTTLQLPGDESRQLTVIHAVDGIEAASGVANRAWMVPEYRSHLLDAARAPGRCNAVERHY